MGSKEKEKKGVIKEKKIKDKGYQEGRKELERKLGKEGKKVSKNQENCEGRNIC